MPVFADNLTTKNNKTVFENTAAEFVVSSVLVWRHGGLMVSALDSGASVPGSSPGRGHCIVFLGKTLHSHSASPPTIPAKSSWDTQWQPRLLARVDAKLLQIIPKLRILLDKGKVTFHINNKRKRFRLLNFPRAAILDFMTSVCCLYCWKAEVLLFEIPLINVGKYRVFPTKREKIT